VLASLESSLKQDYETRRVPAGSASPIDQLVVALRPDGRGRARQVWLTPLPGLDNELDPGLSLLQFFAELPFEAVARAEAELQHLILLLNNQLPLGGFGRSRPGGPIFFRYVLLLGPDSRGNAKVVLEAVTLVDYVLARFAGTVEAVASGQKSAAEVLAALERGT
jgi:hypothetical protein